MMLDSHMFAICLRRREQDPSTAFSFLRMLPELICKTHGTHLGISESQLPALGYAFSRTVAATGRLEEDALSSLQK